MTTGEITWSAGTQVRLVSDPGTVGVCTGHTRRRTNGRLLVQAVFPGLGATFQPESELEALPSGPEDPYQLIAQGTYGRAEHLRRTLTHIQLSGRLANLVYSMDTTHTEFYPYQYKPVLAFLESPSNGLLIADEVGLGKTIEAGLIWTEIRARLDARRLVVVCPAMLREKWKLELARRFGVDAEIMNAQEFHAALQRPKEDVPDGKAIVSSFQGLRPPRGWREDGADEDDSPRRRLARFLLERADSDPLIDLLVIDEAHYLRNPDSLTNRLGQLLREVSEHAVLLSATPINLSDMDLFHLLNVADPDTFRYPEFFPQLVQRNAPLVKAREEALRTASTEEDIKALLRQAGNPLGLDALDGEVRSASLQDLLDTPMPPAFLESQANRVTLANRIERLNMLGHVVNRTRKSEVTEFKTVRRPTTEVVEMTEEEAAFYLLVTETIREYAWSRDISDGFLLAPPQRQVASCMVAAARSWKVREQEIDELLYSDLGADTDTGDPTPLIDTLVREALSRVDVRELERNDSKYQRLLKVLRTVLTDNPEEKVIVFSYFRETLKYLGERLKRDGIESQLLMGGMAETKQTVIDQFQGSTTQRVLLSSEVAAEGVDLQFCSVLVNYDLPWNPMRVEQRIGRIDRIGQKEEVIVVWNLCSKDTIDEKILERLYARLRIFERALGGFEAVLGDQIRELTSDLLRRHLSPEEESSRIEQTAVAVEHIQQQQEQLEAQASNLIAHGGYVIEAVHAAHEFSRRITDLDLLIYVRDYLQRHAIGHVFQEVSPGIYELCLPFNVANRLDEFLRARRLSGQTRLGNGMSCQCRFVNKVRLHQERVEQVSQFHPLVRFISHELEELREARFPLVAARVSRDQSRLAIKPGAYTFAVRRWMFAGIRTEEELRARAVRTEDQVLISDDVSLNIVNQARALGHDWAAAPGATSSEAIQGAMEIANDALDQDYDLESTRRENENTDRIGLQRLTLTQHRDRRLARLRATAEAHVLAERHSLARATEGQIDKLSTRIQLQLEGLTQKTQFRRSQFDVICGVIDVT